MVDSNVTRKSAMAVLITRLGRDEGSISLLGENDKRIFGVLY
jgi:hypothetical protein